MLLERKVLVVEDNGINRAALCVILSSQYAVLEAENGAQALPLLEKYREGIALILLDMVMPVIVTTSNNSEIVQRYGLSPSRLHGDEFLVAMRHMSSMEDAHKKETAIRRAYYESSYVDPDSAACFAGTGLWNAEKPLDEIIRRACETMYVAKASGKDGCFSRKGVSV